MKQCGKCLITKPITEYHKTAASKDGLISQCKPCKSAYRRSHYLKNKEKILNQTKEYHQHNPHIKAKNRSECNRRAYLKNQEARKAAQRAYYQNNREKYIKYSAERYARKTQAMPPWLDEADQRAILAIYALAARKSEQEGILYHVDHIHPLRGKNICGLHVPWNLQIITAEENLRKSNKFN